MCLLNKWDIHDTVVQDKYSHLNFLAGNSDSTVSAHCLSTEYAPLIIEKTTPSFLFSPSAMISEALDRNEFKTSD